MNLTVYRQNMNIAYHVDGINCRLTNLKSLRECTKAGISYLGQSVRLFLYQLALLRIEEVKFIPYLDFTPKNFSDPDNSSALGALFWGYADLTAHQTVVTLVRSKIISYSTPFIFEERCFYLKVPTLEEQEFSYDYIVKPFSLSSWFLLATLFVFYLILKQFSCATKQIRSLKNFRKIFFVLSFAFFEAAYESNLRAIVSSRTLQIHPFSTLNDVANEIAKGNKKLLLQSLATDVYEIINNTQSSGFEALRSALKINGPLIIPDEKERFRMIFNDDKYMLFNSFDIRLTGFQMFGRRAAASVARICLDEVPKLMRAVPVHKEKQVALLEEINLIVPFLYIDWRAINRDMQILQSLLPSRQSTIATNPQPLSLRFVFIPSIFFLVGNFCACFFVLVERAKAATKSF